MAAPQALEGTGRRGLLPRLTLNPLQDPSSLSPLTRNQAASFTRPPIALDPGAVPPRGAGPDQAGHCRLWADGTGSLGPQDAQARESCALVPRQNAWTTVSPVTLGVSCHLKPPSPPCRSVAYRDKAAC